MNKHIFYLLWICLIIFIGSTALAAPSPIPTPTPEDLLFSESFSTGFIGQTELAGYWTSWAAGTDYTWEVTIGGPGVGSNKVFEGTGDPGWEGIWSTETIDISSCGDVEISIDVYGDINSIPPDDAYVEFFYQTDNGPLMQWFITPGI